MTRARRRTGWLLTGLMSIGGCSSAREDDARGAGGAAGSGGSGASASLTPSERGGQVWINQCAVCHGEVGEGGIAPPVNEWVRGEDTLVEHVAAFMPEQNPEQCVGECASDVARFILTELTPQALRCEGDEDVRPSPRRLRLLNRREYRNTVRDLFAAVSGESSSCTSDLGCGFRQSCTGGACVENPCTVHRFVFDPGGTSPSSVHLAGSFNDWSTTSDALQLDPTTGTWTLDRSLSEGTHAYKFVVDESEWLEDSRNPDGVPDGFGGQNSLLKLSCEVQVFGFDPTVGFPTENRPDAFAYDSHAATGLVTAPHVDAHLRAARDLSEAAQGQLTTLVPCELSSAECITSFVHDFGRKAFRRPLSETEQERYESLIEAGATPEEGIATAIEAFLVSPHFLYRSELGEDRGDGVYELTAWETASALSYTIWGTAPDAELSNAAETGALDAPEGIEAQARRLLSDPRSRPLIEDFGLMWLGAENIVTVDKSAALFPDFSPEMRQALHDETARLLSHVVFDSSHTLQELLTADYTFANSQSAALYGLPDPGAALTQVSLDGRRIGILGHASVLGTTAHSDQSSPIRRGLFVRTNLLCHDLPPPPPNAGGVPDVDPTASTRERFRQHTDNEACAGCHQYIDSVGFGLERFDAVGAYREQENGQSIPPEGSVSDLEALGVGTSDEYLSQPELARLIAESEAAQACAVRQYYRFARGYRETYLNRCARLRIQQRFAASSYDLRELFIAVTLSPDFRLRK